MSFTASIATACQQLKIAGGRLGKKTQLVKKMVQWISTPKSCITNFHHIEHFCKVSSKSEQATEYTISSNFTEMLAISALYRLTCPNNKKIKWIVFIPFRAYMLRRENAGLDCFNIEGIHPSKRQQPRQQDSWNCGIYALEVKYIRTCILNSFYHWNNCILL